MDGWLQDPQQLWSVRFHRDPERCVDDVRILVDHGREMSDGRPALLKSRRNMRYEDAVSLWKELLRSGWKEIKAVW